MSVIYIVKGLNTFKNTHYIVICIVKGLNAQHCQKYALHQKNVSSKDCLEFSFVQKTQRALMSIYLRDGIRGLQRLSSLKYYNDILEWES